MAVEYRETVGNLTTHVELLSYVRGSQKQSIFRNIHKQSKGLEKNPALIQFPVCSICNTKCHTDAQDLRCLTSSSLTPISCTEHVNYLTFYLQQWPKHAKNVLLDCSTVISSQVLHNPKHACSQHLMVMTDKSFCGT